MKKKLIALFMVMVMAASFSAFGMSAAAEEGDKVIKIGISFPTFDNPSWVQQRKYFEEKAPVIGEKYGYTIELSIASADGDAAAQNATIKDYINSEMDIICASAVDSESMKTSLDEAAEAGIPFISFLRNISEGAANPPQAEYVLDAYMCSYASNKVVMQKMIDDGFAPEDIKAIEVLGALSDQNAVLYSEGFQAAAEEFGIEVVEQVASEWSIDTCLQRFSPIIQAHPEVNYIQNPTDALLAGITPALERIDRLVPYGEEGHIYIASAAGIAIGLDNVREGYCDCTAVEDIDAVVEQCLEAAVALYEGREPASEPLEVPTVTQDNFDEIAATGKLWALDAE